MQRVIFETASEFAIVCLLVGIAYAAIQYVNTRRPWNKTVNTVLFAFRAVLVAFLALLLLGPIVKQVSNYFERPVFVLLHDNSVSVKHAADSSARQRVETGLLQAMEELQARGYEAIIQDLQGNQIADSFRYAAPISDINGALKAIDNRFEGRNVAGVILASDGIYNSGLSPLYSIYNFPVHTVGIGDTLQRLDIAIKNVAYNRIAYQGNKFPIRAEIQIKNLPAQPVTVTLTRRGRVIERKTQTVSGEQLAVFDFQPEADQQGIQKYDIQVETHKEEQNTRNNRASVYIEVIEGKKKILLVAPAPHPDIKALREVIEQNSNYEFRLHIPGIQEQSNDALQPARNDLVILHQSPDLRGKTRQLFQRFAGSDVSLFFVLGQHSDLPLIERERMPIAFENAPRDYDEVTPVVNPAFSNFTISPEHNAIIGGFPPVSVHYGKVQTPASATPLLYQRVGSIVTDRPLLTINVDNDRKVGILFGEGIWRWRLNEFDRTEKTEAFDEVFGKLVQFLSTTEEKRKFRSYPIEQEFSETEAVVFESQVYNDIFEPVFGNAIDIEITDESGQKSDYNYVTSPGNTRYQIGGLGEGVYRFRASTTLNGKREEVSGEFAVVAQDAELQNLTADFDLLQKLSANTGGRFVNAGNFDQLTQFLQQTEARTVIHSEETYDAVINIKWIFWLLLLLVTAEWALRKFHGSY